MLPNYCFFRFNFPTCLPIFFQNGESEAKGCFYPWDTARQFFSWKGPTKEEEREGQEDEGPEAEISRGCHEKGHEKGKKR